MIGGQASLEVGMAAALVAPLVGAFYGAVSGFAGGAVDAFMMRVIDAGLSIPSPMVLIVLSVIFHPNPLTMIFIIAAFYWLGVSRLVRGETLTLRTREYVQAVKVVGGGGLRAITRHVLPNATGTIIVQATFAMADAILILAGLGFLGLGIQPPRHRLGVHAVQRNHLRQRRLLVGHLPARYRDHRHRAGVQLDRRRPPRRLRNPPSAPIDAQYWDDLQESGRVGR
jgi:peptide/nickel transport system permease protein